jgi:hypothetical protein
MIFFSCDDGAERLTFQSEDEAIGNELDEYADRSNFPEILTVYRWERKRPPLEAYEIDLEDYLQRLDEEFGDPEAATVPCDSMVQASREFALRMRALYEVWACECVGSETVDVAEWLKVNPEF